MIDYLERVFAPETGEERPPDPQGAPLPRMEGEGVTWGSQADLPPVGVEEGRPPEMARLSVPEGGQWGLTAPAVEEGERFPFFPRGDQPQQGARDPVEKLRRDSRRYDNDFFWY